MKNPNPLVLPWWWRETILSGLGCMRLTSFVCFLVAVVSTQAAEPVRVDNSYSARVWITDDGLPENRIVGVAQATDGYLWVATLAGVVRFDGVRFQNFDSANFQALTSGTMQGLLRDRGGRFWLAKELGVLVSVVGAQVKVLTPKDGLPEKQAARSMTDDSEGNLWISYSRGAVVRLKNGRVEHFSSTNGLPSEGVCWLATDRSGQVWFCKNGQVGIFRNEGFVVLMNVGSASTRIAPARDEGIWICTPRQVSKYTESGGLVRLAEFQADQKIGEPTTLLEDRDGVVWVGTDSAGLYRFDRNGIARVETSHLSILGLMEDREGNLWVGTRGGGLNRIHRRMISMSTAATGLPFVGVQSVCQDATGALWAVGENGVLARKAATTWNVQTLEATAPRINCTCVAADSKGAVWIGTRNGAVYRWDNGSFTNLMLPDSFPRKYVRSLLATSNGDLWISTDGADALYRLRGANLQIFKLRSGFRYVRAMSEDAAGNVWAGASDGLLVRVSGDVIEDVTPQPLAASIRCLYSATNGDLWIGYAGVGVGRLRNNQITQFNRDQGLPNSYVSQILADGCGNLWFAGNQGIFKVRERDFDDVAAGLATGVVPFVYGRSEGLQGIQASFDFSPSAVRTADNHLLFSMLTGLAEVRLDYARSNRLPPPVCLERVTADGRMYAIYEGGARTIGQSAGLVELTGGREPMELRLPPGLQNVRFEFSALSFVATENIQFRYRLVGLDERWVNADTRRVAEYTHPPPGHYRFQVIACNNDGLWNETGDALSIIFEAYYWEKPWFKVGAATLAFISGCGLVVFILRRRHHRQIEQLERQRELELERTRIARDLHDDLGVGLTEIGLLGDLAGSSSGLPGTSRDRLQEITDRARSLVGSLDEIVWAINPANDSSESLMDYFFPYAQKLLGRAGIRCRLQVAEPLPAGKLNAERRHEFFHAYKEALNNVLRHSGASQVQVSLAAEQGSLVICVADNGRGLAETNGKASHHGLAGMRERLQRLGGRCEITSPAGGGTTVTFIIPVPPEL